MMNKNRDNWNKRAAAYAAFNHTPKMLGYIKDNPARAFHPAVWKMLCEYTPDLRGQRICVPSSGDNHAVFAFAMCGAKVTSCDISEKQLFHAERVAKEYGWDASITFVCTDTMQLDGVEDGVYDLVYTSNGVHVWIDDLAGMYRNVYRVLKPGGVYMMYEIHPFLRPFDSEARVKKPYDRTGPFESETEVTFAWRVMDIQNAVLDAGLRMTHVEEMFAEKDYDCPFWIPYRDLERGVSVPREEVDRMHDWRNNPLAALPNWIGISAVKD